MLFDQLTKFSNRFLSAFSYSSRKGYSTQYALANLLQKWKKILDKTDRIVGTLLMDLSKRYDCVNHELIVTNLAAYGLNEGSLKSIQNFSLKKKKWVKTRSSQSEWLEIIIDVPQGSMLQSILFSILN